MRIFCNICCNRLCKQTKGYVTSCCHVLCHKCLVHHDRSGGGSVSSNGSAVAKAVVPTCTKCRRRCTVMGVNSDMPPAVQKLFVNPSQALSKLGKAYRFQTLQMWSFHQMMAGQRRRQARLQRIRAASAALTQRAGMLRQLRPRITLLRTELRNKFTCLVQAIKRGESVEEVRKIYQSAQRTGDRSRKLIEMTLPKLQTTE